MYHFMVCALCQNGTGIHVHVKVHIHVVTNIGTTQEIHLLK